MVQKSETFITSLQRLSNVTKNPRLMEGIKLPTSRDFRLKMDKVSDSILQNQENDDDTNAAEDTAEDEVKT